MQGCSLLGLCLMKAPLDKRTHPTSSETQRLLAALPDLRLAVVFALVVLLFFPGTAGASLSPSSLVSSAAASSSGSPWLPAGSSAGLSWTPEAWDAVSSSLLRWSWPVLWVAEMAVKSCEVGSRSASSSCCWFSFSPVSFTIGCVESRQSSVGSVRGLRLSAARWDSLEDAAFWLSNSLCLWKEKTSK